MRNHWMQPKAGTIQPTLMGGVVVAAAIVAGVAAFFLFDPQRPISPLGPEYSYDLSEYIEIDPDLILYEQTGEPFATGLSQSRVIVVGPHDTVWVAGDKQIRRFSPDGRPLRTLDCEGEPTCLAIDNDGRLYVGLIDYIVVFDASGALSAQWPKPHADALLTSLAVLGESVFAAEASDKTILRYDKNGTLVMQFGQPDPDRHHPGFLLPSPFGFNLAAAPDGLLRVINPGRHLIEAWTIDGHREWWWGTSSVRVEGFSGCCNPSALALLPNGHYITSEKGLIRVKEYDDQGRFVGVVAGPKQLDWVGPLRVYESPQEAHVRGFGVAVDTAGRVYVLDVFRNTVRVFERIKNLSN